LPFFANFLNVRSALGPFRIRKNVPQNNATDAFTKTLSHEFRNKIEKPRAMSVMLLVKSFRSAFDSLKVIGSVERIFIWWTSIDLVRKKLSYPNFKL